MIRINQQAEPENFDREVRAPGIKSLINKIDFDPSMPLDTIYPNKEYPRKIKHWYATWTKCLGDLHVAYGNICAYLGIEIEHGHIDHFRPKSCYYGLAYEWDNYRLAQESVNQKKSASEDIYDPFTMPEQVFYLDILQDSFCLQPNHFLPEELQARALRTIDALDLNNSLYCNFRKRRWIHYHQRHVSDEYMQKSSPYIWSEIVRQNLINKTI